MSEAQVCEQEKGTGASGSCACSGKLYQPLADVVELAKEFVLVADMPGVKSNEIDIEFKEGSLTIRGPVANRRPDEAKKLWQEYGVGEYRRTFRVGDAVDASRITAEYADGVLRLRLPKAEAVLPRKIQVGVS